MTDLVTPDWIKKIEADEEAETVQAEEKRNNAALKILAYKSPGFVSKLIRELAIASDRLSKIGIKGSFSLQGNPEIEQNCRVLLRLLPSVLPKQTSTDIHYRKGDAFIRCYTLEGDAFNLSFCVYGEHDTEVGVMSGDFPEPMDEKRAAQFIFMPMVERLKGRKIAL